MYFGTIKITVLYGLNLVLDLILYKLFQMTPNYGFCHYKLYVIISGCYQTSLNFLK